MKKVPVKLSKLQLCIFTALRFMTSLYDEFKVNEAHLTSP